jgi:hypothetical protein
MFFEGLADPVVDAEMAVAAATVVSEVSAGFAVPSDDAEVAAVEVAAAAGSVAPEWWLSFLDSIQRRSGF